MSRLGAAFGKMIYLLDALEDYDKDFRRGQFNAFRAAFDLTEAKLNGAARRRAIDEITNVEREIVACLSNLPLSEADKILFSRRLQNNVAAKLKINLPILKVKTCQPRKRLTIAQRWQNAVRIAGELSAKNWQMPLTFALVAVLAFLAPAQIAKTKSWQECAALSFNLMFLGSIVGAVVGGATWAAIKQNVSPEAETQIQSLEEKRRRQEWCDYCDCDCCVCDCCDGCDCCGCDCN